MGAGASINNLKDLERDAHLGSAEPCDVCDSSVTSSQCDPCGKVMCKLCCPHRDNLLYAARCIVHHNGQIVCSDKNAPTKIEAKCVTFNPARRTMLVACEFFYQDNNCKCCVETTQWKTFKYSEKRKSFDIVTQRLHACDKSIKMVGGMCTSRKKNKSYFTYPSNKSVYKLDSFEGFKLAFEITGTCYGIACFNDGIALSVEIVTNFQSGSEWQVQLYDFRGLLRSQIFSDTDGDAYFGKPLCLCSNDGEDKLFVSDEQKNAIFIFDVNCELIAEVKDPAILVRPRGLTCDEFENIYVACERIVVQVLRRGQACRQLLTLSTSDVAMDLCFDVLRRQLVVVQKSGMITFFNVTPAPRLGERALTTRF